MNRAYKQVPAVVLATGSADQQLIFHNNVGIGTMTSSSGPVYADVDSDKVLENKIFVAIAAINRKLESFEKDLVELRSLVDK